ncbi:unnamed protein product [Rhizoctonia solani]|uniref:F-box domain-containing protein n=1 Tax=Rhizoctonia solani TaxID=456999 RepID=A0A8H3HHY5_9AGAM|nr:unnamed protein product [Rhizoctonia solani]
MLLDLPPEILYFIFLVLDDKSQRSFVATCRAFRHWVPQAWKTITFTGPRVKSQLNHFVHWIDKAQGAEQLIQNIQNLFIRACLLGDAVSPGFLEGEENIDIEDEDIANLLARLVDTLRLLAIDLPPMLEDHLFDDTLSCIAQLHKLERLYLGRVKVNDGYEIRCDYTNLKEATMIWCHGIVEQKLLVDQHDLEHLDVHDSWDIGNLSIISYQWHKLKSFRFSAVDHTYATRILESGRGAMTSLEAVSIEVPMNNATFFKIVSELSYYPIRRFHLCISGQGLEVFHSFGSNRVPDDFGPNWLAYISDNLKDLEELVLDYRTGGSRFELEWPDDQVMYAGALAFAQNLHTLAISVHALPTATWDECRETAQMYFEHIPSLRVVHFPAMPILPERAHKSDSSALFRGYTMRGRPGQANHTEGIGDTYRPFWITHGPDVATDRHRREGGLSIVASRQSESGDDLSDVHIVDDPMDGLPPHEVDFFDQEDADLSLWFPDPETETEDETDDWSLDDDSQEVEHPEDTPLPTSEEWMEGLATAMTNVNLGLNQLDFSELDGHSSSSSDAFEDVNDSDLSADL